MERFYVEIGEINLFAVTGNYSLTLCFVIKKLGEVKMKILTFRSCFFCAILLSFAAFCGLIYAEETAAIPEQSGVQAPKEPTREENLERLNRILRNRQAVREAVPGVELIGDQVSGHIEYEGTKIESLDDESLKSLLDAVVNESRAQQMKNMERIQKQLKQVENVQKINEHLNATRKITPAPLRVVPRADVVAPAPRTAPASPPQAPPRAPQTR